MTKYRDVTLDDVGKEVEFYECIPNRWVSGILLHILPDTLTILQCGFDNTYVWTVDKTAIYLSADARTAVKKENPEFENKFQRDGISKNLWQLKDSKASDIFILLMGIVDSLEARIWELENEIRNR